MRIYGSRALCYLNMAISEVIQSMDLLMMAEVIKGKLDKDHQAYHDLFSVAREIEKERPPRSA